MSQGLLNKFSLFWTKPDMIIGREVDYESSRFKMPSMQGEISVCSKVFRERRIDIPLRDDGPNLRPFGLYGLELRMHRKNLRAKVKRDSSTLRRGIVEGQKTEALRALFKFILSYEIRLLSLHRFREAVWDKACFFSTRVINLLLKIYLQPARAST